jgi:hypothetical protein
VIVRVLVLLAALFCAGQAQAASARQSFEHYQKIAQLGQAPSFVVPTPASGCSQATAFLARNGNANAAATTTAICGMVSDGDWQYLDWLYGLATNNTTNAALNWVSTSYTATVHGTATSFTASLGWKGDAGSFYLDTGFIPFTAGGNYSTNSATLGVCIPTSRTTGEGWVVIGAQDAGVNYHDLYPKFTDGNAYAQFSGNVNAAVTDARGVLIGQKTSATALALYRNGSSIATSANGAGLLPPVSVYLFAENNNGGGAANFSGDTIAFAFAGGGQINAARISARINTYMSTLGVGTCY